MITSWMQSKPMLDFGAERKCGRKPVLKHKPAARVLLTGIGLTGSSAPI